MMVPVTHIDANPDNPRADLGDLADLEASIREVGVLQPLLVRPNGSDDSYMLVAGHRRLAAAIRAGLSAVPVVVSEADAEEAVALALVENLHRADIHPLDEAAGFATLRGFGWKQEAIARTVGVSAPVVSKRLRLLDLPDDVRALVRAGELSVETGYELAAAARRHGIDASRVAATLVSYHPSRRADALAAAVKDAKWDQRCDEFAETLIVDGHRLLPGEWEYRRFKPSVPAWPVTDSGWDATVCFDDNDAHRSEPCSRFVVGSTWSSEDGGRVPAAEWWCVDPNRHTAGGDSPLRMADAAAKQLAAKQREVEAEKAKAERLKAIRKHRRSYIDRLFGDVAAAAAVSGHADAVVDRAFWVLVDRLEVTVARQACELLSLEPAKVSWSWDPDSTWDDWRAPLRTALTQDLYRTLAAIAIAHGEAMDRRGGLDNLVESHLEFLARLGYQPPAEGML
jgi:ParB/RepB/Spo0J family partition protein